jgi:hypothetical protein
MPLLAAVATLNKPTASNPPNIGTSPVQSEPRALKKEAAGHRHAHPDYCRYDQSSVAATETQQNQKTDRDAIGCQDGARYVRKVNELR